MKKIISALLAMAMLASMAGCSGKEETKSDSAQQQESEKVLKIGVVQLVEHPALDDAYRGFVDGLKEYGYTDGENIKIDFNNAQGEQATCVTIAEKLVNDKSDLILAIATPAAQAVANKTSEIPVLVTAVTDPASAKLCKANEKPETNVTGTSDLNPIEKQMELLLKIVPNAKKVGMLYSSSEAISEFQVQITKKFLTEKGIETVDATVSASNEIQQVVSSLNGKVDAIFAPTDNMISSSMVLVADVCSENKIPTIVGEPAQVDNGGLATDGINYYNLGKQTAAMASKILKGEAKPQDMPIEYLEKTEVVINKKTAEKMGLTIPEEVVKAADRVVE